MLPWIENELLMTTRCTWFERHSGCDGRVELS